MNKWSNLFGDDQSLNIMTNKARQGNPYKDLYLSFARNEHVRVLESYTAIHLFIMYRSFMDLFINLERKLFGAIMPTIGSDLSHLTSNHFTNLNDTLSLYCKITRWHIRANAVTLQERINVLNSSDNFLLKDAITDPGVLSERLQKEAKLINDLGGTEDGLSITEKNLCILFRKGINSTVEGRESYKSTFEKIDSHGETYIFQRIKLEIDQEYRDFVLPKLQQVRSGKAFLSNIDDGSNATNESANSSSQNENKKTTDGIKYGLCFDFIRKGHCERGKLCKYTHSDEIKGMIAHGINASAHYSSNTWEPSWTYDESANMTSNQYDHEEQSYYDDEQSHYIANRSTWRPMRGRGKGGKGKGRRTNYPSYPSRYPHFGKGGKGGKGKGKGKGTNRFSSSTWEHVVPPPTEISATEARILELDSEQNYDPDVVYANAVTQSSQPSERDGYNYDFNEYPNYNNSHIHNNYYDNDTY